MRLRDWRDALCSKQTRLIDYAGLMFCVQTRMDLLQVGEKEMSMVSIAG